MIFEADRGFMWAFSEIFGPDELTLGRTAIANQRLNERLWEHVTLHSAQSDIWGPIFIPAYLGAGFWQWIHGRDPYIDNPFEPYREQRRRGP